MIVTNLIRDALNRRLHDRGYSLRWRPPQIAGRELATTFDLLASHLMLTVAQPYCVGIGANDGVTHDPLHPFIRDHGWRGVMVEPMPDAFEALRRNYTSLPHIELVQAAIGVNDGTATLYAAEVTDAQSLRMSLHASFDRDVLLRARQWYPDIEERIVPREVPVLRLDTLLARLGRQHVDVLKIDTEGYDLEILRTVDLTVVKPRLVLAEHAHLPRASKVEMADRLLAAGFRVSMTDLDMLGYRSH